jgi:hypothetical protein
MNGAEIATWRRALPGLCLLLSFLAPALSAQTKPYEVVTVPTLMPGDPIPTPKGRVILTVKGAAGRQGPLKLDLGTLERIGLVRYTTRNRWYPKPVTFEGVLGSVFLDVVGAPKDATVMKLRALNDYMIKLPIADLRRWPVMLAVKMNGKYMSVRDKGPIWVVYPAHLNAELADAGHQGKWIWQLAEINFQ